MPDPKIKAKDLSYDPTLPPFLQRLHAQEAGRGGDPDRHEHAIARPKRAKKDEEDDGPTIVDESGDLIGKEELAKMNGAATDVKENKGSREEAAPESVAKEAGVERKGDAQKITDGNVAHANKKRKVAKVVGDNHEAGAAQAETYDAEKSKLIKKSKKKSKPIKLAFDDGDDGAVT